MEINYSNQNTCSQTFKANKYVLDDLLLQSNE